MIKLKVPNLVKLKGPNLVNKLALYNIIVLFFWLVYTALKLKNFKFIPKFLYFLLTPGLDLEKNLFVRNLVSKKKIFFFCCVRTQSKATVSPKKKNLAIACCMEKTLGVAICWEKCKTKI